MKNLQFYKPNKKNTGHACSFWVNEDGTINCSMIKQSGWNEKNRTGQFSANKDNPNGRVISKISEIEACAIISAVRRRTEFSAYHRSEKQVLNLSFKSMFDRENPKKHTGYSFSINKEDAEDSTNKVSFYLMLDYGEAELLAIYLNKAVDESFTGEGGFSSNKKYPKKLDKSVAKTKIDEPPVDSEDLNSNEFDDDDW